MDKSWMRIAPLLLAAGVAACHKAPPATDEDQNNGKPRPAAAASPTDSIRNTDHIGYSGSAIADKVDGAIQNSQQRPGQLDDQLKKSGGEDAQ